ncbi:hypothetical protein D3C76_573470 [compost metagenome]
MGGVPMGPDLVVGPFALNPGPFLKLEESVECFQPSHSRYFVSHGQATGRWVIQTERAVIVDVAFRAKGR